jgi:hypothetical protein
MYPFLKIFLIVLLALALIDWLADRDRRADTTIPNAKPGWALLSGGITKAPSKGGLINMARKSILVTDIAPPIF